MGTEVIRQQQITAFTEAEFHIRSFILSCFLGEEETEMQLLKQI